MKLKIFPHMIHTMFQCTGSPFETRLEKTNLSKPIQHALIVLDELGLILAIQTVKYRFRTPLSHSKIFLPLTAIQYALVGERILWMVGKVSGIHSHKFDSLIYRTKELGAVLLCNLSYPHFLIHEYGHALSAKALFKNANPKVLIKPFTEGGTKFAISNGLRGIGKALGKKRALCIVTLGGLGSSLIFSIGGIALAKLLRKRCPSLAHFLKLHAVAQLTQEVFYAVSFYWTSPMSRRHDLVRFCRLSKIPAYVPILTLITLPVLEWLALQKYLQN